MEEFSWLNLLVAVISGGLAGTFVPSAVTWLLGRHKPPIESQEAAFNSFERQIASAEKRGDAEEGDRLRKEMEQQEEAWRAQQGVRSKASKTIDPDEPALTGEKAKALRKQLESAKPLLSLTADDHFYRGSAFFNLGDRHGALEEFNQSLSLNPDRYSVRFNKAVVLGDLGNFAEALQIFEDLLLIRPLDPEVHHNKGVILQNLGRFQEALEAFDRAEGLRPNQAKTISSRGVALRYLQRFQEAEQEYDRALAVDPSYWSAVYNKACMQSMLQQGREALQLLARAIAGDQKFRKMARTDADLAFLRDHPDFGPRFRELVGEDAER